MWGFGRRGLVDLIRGFDELVRGFRGVMRRLGDLLAAEPPVVFVRVVVSVIEAPVRRGLAFSHIPMLSLTCKSMAFQRVSLRLSTRPQRLLPSSQHASDPSCAAIAPA
jgi:hypothetical protein